LSIFIFDLSTFSLVAYNSRLTENDGRKRADNICGKTWSYHAGRLISPPLSIWSVVGSEIPPAQTFTDHLVQGELLPIIGGDCIKLILKRLQYPDGFFRKFCSILPVSFTIRS
jgi:hypothetical protein